jgi:hypothetical protein
MASRRAGRADRERVSGYGRRDWRQFGNDPRDMPDWALLASLLEELKGTPGCKDRIEVIEARRLYAAGEIDAGFNLLRPVLSAE